MTTRFLPVPDLPALEVVVACSHTRPVVLFLHNPGCPASVRAQHALEQLDREIPLVDVRHAQSLTREIERRTGVRHESPHVLLLQQG